MRHPANGHRTDLFPLPQNEHRLVLSNEVIRPSRTSSLSKMESEEVALFTAVETLDAFALCGTMPEIERP